MIGFYPEMLKLLFCDFSKLLDLEKTIVQNNFYHFLLLTFNLLLHKIEIIQSYVFKSDNN